MLMRSLFLLVFLGSSEKGSSKTPKHVAYQILELPTSSSEDRSKYCDKIAKFLDGIRQLDLVTQVIVAFYKPNGTLYEVVSKDFRPGPSVQDEKRYTCKEDFRVNRGTTKDNETHPDPWSRKYCGQGYSAVRFWMTPQPGDPPNDLKLVGLGLRRYIPSMTNVCGPNLCNFNMTPIKRGIEIPCKDDF